MRRRAAKVDANQSAVVDALTRHGAKVLSLAAIGDGVYDLLVGHRRQLMLMEVKDGDKPPSARQLTALQIEFRREWDGYPLHVVTSVDEALEVLFAVRVL